MMEIALVIVGAGAVVIGAVVGALTAATQVGRRRQDCNRECCRGGGQ